MKPIICALLAACVILTATACGQNEPVADPTQETQEMQETQTTPENQEAQNAAEPDADTPLEPEPDMHLTEEAPSEVQQDAAAPLEPEFSEQGLVPGEPVFVEANDTSVKSGSADGADDMPVEVFMVFDHYGDPPQEGTVRLVYTDYSLRGVLVVESKAEVDKILNIVDTLSSGSSDGDTWAGGYQVIIQAVRGGVQQYYSISSGARNGAHAVVNGREAGKWYATGEENFKFLMSYFSEVPQ